MTTQETISFTQGLVAIPSTSDNPIALRQAVEFVASIVASYPNIKIERFEGNGRPSFLAYKGTERPKKFDILLNGHVDVVPGLPEQFVPYIRDDKLYGRGVLDMKATSLMLADVFCELVNEVPYSLGLQIVSDEEIGGYVGVKQQIDLGVRADFVIMGEYATDRNTIYNAARGLCWAEIAFKGRAAHGAHLWNGSNAVLKAGDFMNKVLKRYPTPGKETWTATANISSLSTPDLTFNRVPDAAVLRIDFRFTQEDTEFASEDSVRALIADIDPEAELLGMATFEPAVYVEEQNRYVQGLRSALYGVSGEEPQFLGRPGSSDGRHFALVGGDIVEFGPYGSGPHSDEEYIELASFDEYRKVIRAFLRKPLL